MNPAFLNVRGVIEQFDRANGRLHVVIGGWVIYANGARREVNPMGALIDPPNDETERLRIVLKYHEERLRLATKKFDAMKQSLELQAEEAIRHADARTPPEPPSDHDIAELRKEQGVVRQLQKEMEAVRKKIVARKPAWMIEREEQADEIREAGSGKLAAIQKIKV